MVSIQGSFKNIEACPDFDQILARFLARFLTRVLARCFGVQHTVYSSTGTEKYSFTRSEEKGEKQLVFVLILAFVFNRSF